MACDIIQGEPVCGGVWGGGVLWCVTQTSFVLTGVGSNDNDYVV